MILGKLAKTYRGGVRAPGSGYILFINYFTSHVVFSYVLVFLIDSNIEVVRLHHVLQPVRPDVAVVSAGEDEVELVLNTHCLVIFLGDILTYLADPFMNF